MKSAHFPWPSYSSPISNALFNSHATSVLRGPSQARPTCQQAGMTYVDNPFTRNINQSLRSSPFLHPLDCVLRYGSAIFLLIDAVHKDKPPQNWPIYVER